MIKQCTKEVSDKICHSANKMFVPTATQSEPVKTC